MVVADENAAKFHFRKLYNSLDAGGFVHTFCTVPAGEESKSLEGLARLWDEFHKAKITRSDLVVAFGGGVTGDLAGFAAATWLRGVPIVQIPTTLLAMVDSSIGGKTAIDLPFGKNLAGAFHQPEMVVIDPDLLGTLPRKHFAEGMAEVIKYGCVFDGGLFGMVGKVWGDGGSGDPPHDDRLESLSYIIRRCAQIKTDVVGRDEFDRGERMLLNFGHTFGHALEKAAGYGNISHGEAVAIGMIAAARLGEGWGMTETGTADRIAGVLKQFALPAEFPDGTDKNAVRAAMFSDKKILSGKINLVLLEKIGAARIVPADMNMIEFE